MIVQRIGRVPRLLLEFPLPPINAGKVHVAFDVGMHPREIKPVGPRKCEFINRSAANDEELILFAVGMARDSQGVVEIAGHERFGVACLVVGLMTDNDGSPTGKWPPDGFPGLAAHKNRMTHGEPLEPAQIGGQVPGEFAVAADHAIIGHGNNDGQLHTATGAAICGWGL
jgi:hypothetical protein